MQVKRYAEENPPHEIGPVTKSQQRQTEEKQGQPVQVVQPDMKSVLHQVRGIARHSRTVILLRRTVQHPANVCPPAAIARSVWITRRICMRMMDAVRNNP